PDDAYRFARGESLTHPAGYKMQLEEPLDFYAVTDHGFFLGIMKAMATPSSEMSQHPDAKLFTQHKTTADRSEAFQGILKYVDPESEVVGQLSNPKETAAAWSNIIDAANRHNDPGRFTTFVAYEYTSGPDFQNLHRNVVFKGDRAPAVPFSRSDSPNPEDLWRWMDEQRNAGMESLAMPHNSNGSNGQMFSLVDFGGRPLDAAYAELRMRNEPLVENTQIKGTSDTHPMLSPNDEWANFEIMPLRIASTLTSDINGSYAREALMNGLEFQTKKGFNPYKFGLVGSSDTHNASWSGNDQEYYGKVGMLDADGQTRGSVPLDEPDANGNEYSSNYYHYWGGSGLAAVWAERNTRDDIYAAFRRKEAFSTTGPRIKVRFFGGVRLPDIDSQTLVNDAYKAGVPMGGDLVMSGDLMSGDEAPEFIVWAMRDPNDQPLQRAQIIKAWVENGKAQEMVYDVACSQGGEVNPRTHRCPDNDAYVDLTNCASKGMGAAELKAKWRDPDFNPETTAFYYVRVLQNPSCRWSTWDALRAGVPPREDLPATIQERAWSSPIWYTPAG
ncbi:MAG: DUF3604 domain-containing protein, partial [Pseudomonadales bacterium]